MISRNPIGRVGKALFLALAALAPAMPGNSWAGPCDIYASSGTPCVAAHSTVRALYSSYSGNLYQVRRSSDNTTRDIGILSAGGYANAAAQDSFCSGTSCVILQIYDQSGRGNHLTVAPAGGAGGADTPSNAIAAQITINGNKAYGVYIAPGNGYRNNGTSGVATGDQPEGMYAIFDGTHYNGGCCFDYGNAETNSRDNGNGTMEAIYFGNIKVWGYGTGNGPWVMADLENGLFSGVNAGYNSNDPTVNYRYLTAIIKGEANHWAIRAGNAQSGSLSTFYDGKRPNPSGYNPMRKEGAIILGTGGDNSNGSAGTFYEGAMTSGYPTDAIENAVQADIVSANYGKSGPSCTTVPSAPGNLQATATASRQINLTWSAVSPPADCSVTYSVFRNGNQVASNLTGGSFTDAGLGASTTYQYFVRAVDAAGSSANSATVSATTPEGGDTETISINAGGSAVGDFLADAYYSGGSTYSTTNSIDTSLITDTVLPQEVLQTERYGEFTYTIPNLDVGSDQTITLYFEESFWTAAGQRTFDVAINGAKVLSAFDIFAAAGGANKAMARTFSTAANSSGQLVIAFTRNGGPDNPKVCGISITSEGGGGGTGSAVSVNAGGSAAGGFVADAYYSGGSTYSTTNTIDTSLVTGTVPPQAVFQTERYGEFTYTIPGFTAGSAQTVTLYFEESYWTAAGQRTFNVAINGSTVLTAFDIFAAAGGANKAIARPFNTTANSSGQAVIQFTKGGGPDNPKICGITVAGP